MTTDEQTDTRPLTDEEVGRIDAYWRAANYLSVGQIYLLDNPLLREPLTLEHVKPRLLGHWGTTPGLNFIYVHLNRLIREHGPSVLYVTGPGHGGPGLVANTYLEGSYTEHYPDVTQDAEGMRKLFRQFSFPGGIPSHTSPETPGSINEGGELGYSLAHAFGAVFDNPDLIACCVVGDGEAETGTLAGSWHSNKFLNPARDGAVLPVLHLNGYKIVGPTVLARMPREELESLFVGYGYAPIFVEGDEPEAMHQRMAAALDQAYAEIQRIQQDARENGVTERPRWPMIVLRSPKGWTGPDEVDGVPVEGTFRSHQVPLAGLAENPEHLALLEDWMRGYRPEELFDEDGRLAPELAALAPEGDRRMGSNPHANGGLLLKDLRMPDWRDYAVDVPAPGAVMGEATRVMGRLLRDVMAMNPETFRVVGPDETASNRLTALFEVTEHITPRSQKFKIAVLTFVDQTGKGTLVVDPIADMLTTEPFAGGRFELYDRGDLVQETAKDGKSLEVVESPDGSGDKKVTTTVVQSTSQARAEKTARQKQEVQRRVDGILLGYITSFNIQEPEAAPKRRPRRLRNSAADGCPGSVAGRRTLARREAGGSRSRRGIGGRSRRRSRSSSRATERKASRTRRRRKQRNR